MKPRSPASSRADYLTELLTRPIVAPLFLAAVVFVIYANSLHGEFVFDDRNVIFRNPELLNLKTFSGIFKLTGWRKTLNVSYGLNFYLGGLNPFGYHLMNVALHALNSIVIFYTLLEVGARRWASLSAATLFAAHPLLTGATSYIAGRSSLLCGTFYFLAFLVFLKGLRASGPLWRVLCFLATVGLFLLAFTTKEEGITLPAFLAAYVWIRSDTRNWLYVALLTGIPFAAAVLSWNQFAPGLAVLSRNEDLVLAGYEPVPPLPTYVRTYLTALVEYVFPKFVWPAGLSVDPEIHNVLYWYSSEFVFAICIVAFLSGALLFLKGKNRLLLRAGIAAMLVSPLAVHVVVPEADVIQEHRVYIAGLGFALIAAWVAEWAYRKWGARATWAAAAVVVVFSVLTIDRNRVWANDVTLWEDAVQKSPGKPRTHVNLAGAYQTKERWTDAVKEYSIATELRPGLVHADLNLGLLYLKLNDLDNARQVFEKLTKTAPLLADGWSNLGIVYIRSGDADRSLEALNRALALKPNFESALFARGDVFSLKGRFDLAVADYKAALSVRPDVGVFRLRLGATYMRLGDLKSAEQEFRALTADPQFGAAANRNLGLLRTQAGNDDEAIAYFQKALAQQSVFPEVHHDLGLVYLQRGATDRAIEEFQNAIAQRPEFEQAIVGLSQAYEKAAKPDQAWQTIEDYLQKFPAHDSPYLRELQRRFH